MESWEIIGRDYRKISIAGTSKILLHTFKITNFSKNLENIKIIDESFGNLRKF
jgi:hypothetical protein